MQLGYLPLPLYRPMSAIVDVDELGGGSPSIKKIRDFYAWQCAMGKIQRNNYHYRSYGLSLSLKGKTSSVSLFPGFDLHAPGARSNFWGVVRVGGQGWGDNSIQFINIGRVGDKRFKE